MPKTLGEWLFLASIGLFAVLGVANQVIATLCLVGSLVLGYREGFDGYIIAMASIFGLLLVGDLISTLSIKPEKILKSLWTNLFVVIVRLAYLVFAGLLFYGLFWDGGLVKYYWAYLTVAVWLTLTNLPWMIFHLALCMPRCRQYLCNIHEEVESRIRERNDNHFELWKTIDKMPGGDKNPFETPVGPTRMCLSANQVVSFIENDEKDEWVSSHLNDCKECLDRVNRYKAVR